MSPGPVPLAGRYEWRRESPRKGSLPCSLTLSISRRPTDMTVMATDLSVRADLRVKPVWLGFYDFAAERNQTRAQFPWRGCFVARK